MKLKNAKKLKVNDMVYSTKLFNHEGKPLEFVINKKPILKDTIPDFFYAEIKTGERTIAYISNEGRRRSTRENRWVFPIEEFEKV